MTDLFEPVVFRGGAEARNRVALAALTNLQSHRDGSLSEVEHDWLARRAEGGFGIVTTCAAFVSQDGRAWPGQIGVHDDALMPGLSRLATTLRSHGALSLVQLFHGGLRANAELSGQPTWSASAGEPGTAGPRAATEQDLARVIDDFTEAALRSHRAGFDGVEIHGAHGYLLTQFLSTVENRRSDRWGGSLENRARLIREITQAVRARVPAPFVVGVRLSPEDFGQARGLDLDESLKLGGWLADDGVDFLHLSLWTASRNTTKRSDSHAVREFRAVVPESVKLFVAGKVWTRADAESLLALGADVVALGRSGIVNPSWPELMREAHAQPRRPPLSPEELRELAVGERFIKYLRNWKDFVAP
jgi:2,4-dienoyl-CoA reductase-like NADH-dependent reductase (Old Yellow Enzyme family)